MREFPARVSKAAIGAPDKIQHPCENLAGANLVEVVEVSSLCLGWRGRFETQERSIGLGRAWVRSHTWPGLVLLGAEGLGMSCEMLLGFQGLSRMCPPTASYSVAWGWTGSSAKAFKGEQNVHQLPPHCFVNLSLVAVFINLCLDLYWLEHAVSKPFAAVKVYSSPCSVSPELSA